MPWLLQALRCASPPASIPVSRRLERIGCQRTLGTNRFSRMVDMRNDSVATVHSHPTSEHLSGRTDKAVPFWIIRKSAGQELSAAAARVAFPRFSAILPGPIEVHAA